MAALFLAGTAAAVPLAVVSPAAHAQKARRGERQPDPRQLLRRMLQAENKQAVAGHEVTFMPDGPQTEQLVKRDPKRGERIQFLRPPGDVIVDNFRKSWHLMQGPHRLVVRESRLAEMRRIAREFSQRLGEHEMSVQLDGTDRVAGRVAYIVRITPPGAEGASARRFWIDRQTGLRLKMEEYGPQRRLLRQRYYLNVDLNPQFSDSDFAPPALPPGFREDVQRHRRFTSVEEAQKAVRFKLRRPTLPTGFELRVVAARTLGEHKVVIQHYANGINSVTLFQTDANLPPMGGPGAGGGFRRPPGRGSNGVPLPPMSSGGPRRGGVQTWRSGGVFFTLVGDLPEDQMKLIAGSLR